MSKMYFTLVGCKHYLGTDFLEKGMKLTLKKEPKNEYDAEAIMVKAKAIGKIGYVGNSPYTIQGDTMSAGRIYDKIGNKAKAKVVYVIPGGAICKIISSPAKIIKSNPCEIDMDDLEEVEKGKRILIEEGIEEKEEQ